MESHSHHPRRRWLILLALGLTLRVLFIAYPRPFDDDTTDYLELGRNLLTHGVYGMGSGNISPTIFRMPAYPLILGLSEQLFRRFPADSWLRFVYALQSLADLGAGLLLAAFARRHISPRAGEFALALAMLCPFTAAYAAIGLTESLSVSAIAVGLYCAARALAAESPAIRNRALILAGLASAFATLLRPDGCLLTAALGAGIFLYSANSRFAAFSSKQPYARALIFLAAALLPLVPWTLRNWQQFHVFEPLAPRYLNDPGERANTGFYRWLRTWSVEYVTTADVFWNVGSDSIDPGSLTPAAFDSPAQQARTLALIDGYNRAHSISADLDLQFGQLAEERIHAHPARYYLLLPAARVLDMLLRPRTEAFYLEVYWWQWSQHPWQSLAAIGLGFVNLFYVALAIWAFCRRRVPWPLMLGGYLVFRCLLLGTMENPEPRYTLECFPIFIVAASAALAHASKPRSQAPN